MTLDVLILSPIDILFEGKAKSVIMPGEKGVFEILPFHKRLMSRLLSGIILVDEREFRIKRGLVKVNQNKVTAIVQEES